VVLRIILPRESLILWS